MAINPKTFSDIGAEIGELVERKNAAYGSSFARAGDFLRLLYPDGLRSEQYDDALLLVRVFDKQMRIATDRDALGESPYADICGYGILGVHLHQEKKGSEQWRGSNGSASGPDAVDSSRDQADGAAQNANPSFTPPTSEHADSEPSPQPDGCSLPLESADAPNATGAANPDAVGRRNRDSGLILRQELVLEVLAARKHNGRQLFVRDEDLPELISRRGLDLHSDDLYELERCGYLSRDIRGWSLITTKGLLYLSQFHDEAPHAL